MTGAFSVSKRVSLQYIRRDREKVLAGSQLLCKRGGNTMSRKVNKKLNQCCKPKIKSIQLFLSSRRSSEKRSQELV